VAGLPPTSALARAQRGHAWGDGEFLLAELADRVGQLLELTRAANTEDHEFHAPEPLPRPGDDRRRAVQARRERRELELDQEALFGLVTVEDNAGG